MTEQMGISYCLPEAAQKGTCFGFERAFFLLELKILNMEKSVDNLNLLHSLENKSRAAMFVLLAC